MSFKVQAISEPLILGEGPHWDDRQQALFFVCIQGKTIHKYVPAAGVHTKTKLDGRVGFIVPVEGATDQFVVGLERKFVVVQWDGQDGTPAKVIREIAEIDTDKPKNRLNDGKADPKGRLFAGKLDMTLGPWKLGRSLVWDATCVDILAASHINATSSGAGAAAERLKRRLYSNIGEGTMGHEEPPGNFAQQQGSLFRLDGARVTQLGDKIGISNGLAWDLRAKAFYYTDSLELNIRRYDYDVDTGEISNKKHIFDLKKNNIEGFPDGTTIDTDGNLWVALFNGSCVLKINPKTGELLQKVPIPAKQVTSATFGGPNMDVLFVTTASMNIDGEQLPPCGATFMVTGLGVKGHPNVNYKL